LEAENKDIGKFFLRRLTMNKNVNNLETLLQKHFDTAFDSPNSIKELRGLILKLAMMGKLVPQDANDQPASELLKEIQSEKKKLTAEGKIRKQKPLPKIKPEEIPYELPDGWLWCRLSEVTSYIQRGKSPKYADTSNYQVMYANSKYFL
jgi:type I restriction enzyme S subunit